MFIIALGYFFIIRSYCFKLSSFCKMSSLLFLIAFVPALPSVKKLCRYFHDLLTSCDTSQKGFFCDHLFQSVSSVAQSCPTLCDPMNCSRPGLPVHHQLPESTQTHVHWISDAIQLFHLLSSPSLPALNPSKHQGLSNESILCMRWPKYWSFSFNISPSNEHPGLISFRMDWLDLLAAQGTLKSLLQHHSSKASIFWHSAFFTVQLSHPYMTTGKTIALTRWTLLAK